MKQKEIFLTSEGDAWFARNRQTVSTRKLPEEDALLCEILDFLPATRPEEGRPQVLEVGCGDGTRLAWLTDNLNADCYGIEPSAQAVASACSKGVNVQQGSADLLPFASRNFDIVIFGFCLYLCDREDLFRIASEADRVFALARLAKDSRFFQPSTEGQCVSPLARRPKLQDGLPLVVRLAP